MSLLAGTSQATKAEKVTDRIGGFALLNSDVHLMTIETAYLHIASSGAKAIAFNFRNDTGRFSTTQYYTSGTAKGCKTFYEKDGKQFLLPGYINVEDILKVAINGGFDDVVVEPKVIKLYSVEAKGEVPTQVQMLTNLIGTQVALGIIKQTVDKTALGSDNEYHPTGETREENDLSKVFHLDGRTCVETESGVTEPTFIITWKEKFKDQVLNKAKGADGATSGAPAPAAAKKTLFK